MKEKITCLLFGMAALLASAQTDANWTVKHHNKVILRSDAEDAVRNTIPVQLSDLNNKGSFIITYHDRRNAKDLRNWVRSVAFFTEADSVLFSKKSSIVRVADTALKKMLQKNRVVKVYTWAIPKDPVQAARVRIRRVHLCTFELN